MLSNANKVDAILDAWLQFIRLEDLSNAKVSQEEAEYRNIKIKGNTLQIEENLFSEYNKKNTLRIQEQVNKIWMLSFPQISVVEEGKSKLCPLFGLDVTSILQGSYQPEGWDIENFEIAEAGENLSDFLGFDDGQLEQLNINDGLRLFLERTFNCDIESLEDWMAQVESPKYQIKKQPYLFEFKGSNFSSNLKQDLKTIRKDRVRIWLEQGNPAYEYLFGIPKPPTHETSYLGAFPTHPPTDSQLKALKHAQSETLTAVQGPPGSGKTTLILHLIAQQVVDRALKLIETGKDTNNLIVVSSTNNRAVENVIERLSEDLSDSLFYLNGGSQKIIKQQGGAKEKLQQALDYLQKSNFDENQYRLLTAQIQKIKKDCISQEHAYLKMRQRRRVDESRHPQVIEELRSLQQQLSDRHRTKNQLEQREATLASYDHLPENVYRQIRSQFNTVGLELPKKTPHWLIRWIYWLLGRTEQQILAKMARRCQSAIDQTLGTLFEIEPPLDRSALHQQRQKIDAGLDRLQELRTVREDIKHQAEELVTTNREHVEKQAELAAIEKSLAIPFEDYYSTFHTQYHDQHKELFNLSRQFLDQEALSRKREIEIALQLYLGSLSEDKRERSKPIRQMADNLEEQIKAISLIFPVITSTLQSIKNMLPWTEQCVDRVIIDESGMIHQHHTFPLLVRTRKAIIVGDPLQIEPIRNQTQQTLDRYFQEAFIKKGLMPEDYDRYSPSEIDTATTYHRAAGATGEVGNLGKGIQLLEHYRCHPDIISFCDHIAKYDLICRTKQGKSPIGTNLVAYHVDGNISSNINQDEIKTIHRVIQHLLKYEYTFEDIGVISAFRAQADALQNYLDKEFCKPNIEIGTVHTFQGSERRVIILSTKVCRQRDSVAWINRRPNLLNVAVSRAKELFILIGNLHRLEEAGSYTRQLVEHIRERGIILEYKEESKVLSKYHLSPRDSWIYDCDHLKALAEALQNAELELYVVTPTIRGKAAQKFNQEVVAALKRGIKITVIYGSPKSGNEDETEGLDETKIKTLFNKYEGARIFQLKGHGTNERILICDTKFAVVGSWNWLSHVYLPACQKQQVTKEVQITRETSVRITEHETIQSKIEEITELIKNLT
jgi:AAA domain